MNIFPAIDLFEGKAVRLFKGDYAQMTVYSENPVEVSLDFKKMGAKFIHIVDLEGAKNGQTPNFDIVCEIKKNSGLFCEVGGGIRSIDVIDRYISAGIDRVILGTAALTEEGFVEQAVKIYNDKIAVGIDILDGFVAIKGWTEKSEVKAFDFCEKMQSIGVKTLICTDISKDGAIKSYPINLICKLLLQAEYQVWKMSSIYQILIFMVQLLVRLIIQEQFVYRMQLRYQNDYKKNYSLP